MDFIHKKSKRARKVSLKIDSNGTPVVTTPQRFSYQKAAKFVNQNLAWIKKQSQLQSKKQNYLENPAQILIFGKQYLKTYQIARDQSKKIQAIYINQDQKTIQVNIPGINKLSPTRQEKTTSKEIKALLKQAGTIYLTKRVPQISQKMRVSYNQLNLRNQKTRWGSCSSQGNLSFNWRLVHFAPKIIDYVIIHELAHLEQPNHSRKFWQLVAKFDPDYKQHRHWLKKHGVTFK